MLETYGVGDDICDMGSYQLQSVKSSTHRLLLHQKYNSNRSHIDAVTFTIMLFKESHNVCKAKDCPSCLS